MLSEKQYKMDTIQVHVQISVKNGHVPVFRLFSNDYIKSSQYHFT